jgi:hypothetical protein
MFPSKFARMFLILRVGIKAARNFLQVETKVKFEPCVGQFIERLNTCMRKRTPCM